MPLWIRFEVGLGYVSTYRLKRTQFMHGCSAQYCGFIALVQISIHMSVSLQWFLPEEWNQFCLHSSGIHEADCAERHWADFSPLCIFKCVLNKIFVRQAVQFQKVTFLQCAFSAACNGVYMRQTAQKGAELTFLHCAFSNVFCKTSCAILNSEFSPLCVFSGMQCVFCMRQTAQKGAELSYSLSKPIPNSERGS